MEGVVYKGVYPWMVTRTVTRMKSVNQSPAVNHLSQSINHRTCAELTTLIHHIHAPWSQTLQLFCPDEHDLLVMNCLLDRVNCP